MPQFYAVFALCAVAALGVATLLATGIARVGFPLPPNDGRLGCVDGLRGYLALSVMLHHFFLWVQLTRLGGVWVAPSIDFLNQLGAGAVGLFFMTTGLVFYSRILAGLRSTNWLTVFVSRIFRIEPLVIVTVGLATVVIMARTGVTPDVHYIGGAARWIATWKQVPMLGYADSVRVNAGVLWSLWYEWLFYLLVLPASAGMMDLVRRRQLPSWIVPAAVLAIGLVAQIVAKLTGAPTSILFYLPLFAVGMLAFEARSRSTVRTLLSKPAAAGVAVFALLIGMATTSDPYLVSLPLFAFFFICVACGNDLGGLLRTRGALVLGECSFGIYLVHGIVLNVLFVDAGALHAHLSLAALPLLLPVAAVAVVLLTPVTYLVVERPAMWAGKSLSKWLTERPVKLDSRELEVAP